MIKNLLHRPLDLEVEACSIGAKREESRHYRDDQPCPLYRSTYMSSLWSGWREDTSRWNSVDSGCRRTSILYCRGPSAVWNVAVSTCRRGTRDAGLQTRPELLLPPLARQPSGCKPEQTIPGAQQWRGWVQPALTFKLALAAVRGPRCACRAQPPKCDCRAEPARLLEAAVAPPPGLSRSARV